MLQTFNKTNYYKNCYLNEDHQFNLENPNKISIEHNLRSIAITKVNLTKTKKNH